MPPGFRIVATELDGPVFADSRGMTLYKWQLKPLRNGSAGERKNEPACYETKTTETSGLMSPYPAGLVLPELDTRVANTVRPFVAALQAAKKPVTLHEYAGANHAFNNDTSAERYDAAAAKLAWERTLAFFKAHLV